MQTPLLDLAVSCLRDSTAHPDMWLEAIPLLANALDAIGGACLACNDETGVVEWARISGAASGRQVEYVEHYSHADLYLPVIKTLGQPRWTPLAMVVPESLRRTSEWYQDFVRPSGIADVLGVQIGQVGARRIFFGVHYADFAETLPDSDPRLQQLLGPLQEAARRGEVQRTLDLRASQGKWTVEHLSDALFVATASGRVIDMNAAAGQMLAGSRALAISQGKLVATDSMEAGRLAAIIAASPVAGPGRMLLGGPGQHHCELVTVYPSTLKGCPMTGRW